MLKRNHIFLSIYQFATNDSGNENVVICPSCSCLTRTQIFKEDMAPMAGKLTCVKYIECQSCVLCLCLPGEYAPTPADQQTGVFKASDTEQEAQRKEQERRERVRRAQQFEQTLDTRTYIDRARVKKAIETRTRAWATEHDIVGEDLRALRHEVLGKMHYGVGPDLEPIEPALRTVGDVKRQLDSILEETLTRQPTFVAGDKVAARAWANITRDEAS